MKLFWTCCVIDILLFLLLASWLLDDMDVRVWLPLAAIPLGMLLGGFALKAAGRPRVATALVAVPGALAIGFVLAVLITLMSGGHH